MSQHTQTTLRQWSIENKTAEEAVALVLDALEGQIEYGFTFTRDDAAICVFQSGSSPGCLSRLFGARGKAPTFAKCNEAGDLADAPVGLAFDVRLFGTHYDARWERVNGNKGRLRICSDREADHAPGSRHHIEALGVPAERRVYSRDHCYLMWGEPSENPPRSSRTELASARIGVLRAPIDSGGRRVVLTAREYFETQEFGNVVFIGERLTRFRPAAEDDAKLGGTR
jgi:CRISPR-associated protein (TIGR03984 family)